MSYKVVQMSPLSASRMARGTTSAQGSWSALPASSLDLAFLKSWLELNPDLDLNDLAPSRRFNWGAISGFALTVAISASFWAGVAWTVSRVWR
jgi:hypothetical protein